MGKPFKVTLDLGGSTITFDLTEADLMERHVAATHEHWAREIHAESEAEEASA